METGRREPSEDSRKGSVSYPAPLALLPCWPLPQCSAQPRAFKSFALGDHTGYPVQMVQSLLWLLALCCLRRDTMFI